MWFDVEAVERFRVNLTCADHGTPPLSSQASMEVLIGDVNDNAPRLSSARYEFRMAENSRPSQRLGTVTADDPDLGPNGLVSFYLESLDAAADTGSPESSDIIQVHPETGVVTLEAGPFSPPCYATVWFSPSCISCVFRVFSYFFKYFFFTFCILGFYTFLSAVLLFYGGQFNGLCTFMVTVK